MRKTHSFLSWNARRVWANHASCRPSLVALQETKLQSITSSKAKMFLPSQSFVLCDAECH